MCSKKIDLTSEREISIGSLLMSAKEVILFGAGGSGIYAVNFLRQKNIDILFFCDNDIEKHGRYIEGIKVFPPEKLEDYKDSIILISSDYAKEIGNQLKEIGVKNPYYSGYCFDFKRWNQHFEPKYIEKNIDKINEAYDLLADNESRDTFISILKFRLTSDPTYLVVSEFDEYLHPRTIPKPGDIIIDGGAWIGDTAVIFSELLDKNGHIFAFESDIINYNELQKNIKIKNITNIVTAIPFGLWDSTAILSFNDSSKNTMQFRIDDNGNTKIHATSIDDFIEAENITRLDLIKMDIEGAELTAIKGARKAISRFKPKLQICLYHQLDDLWEIPLLIKSLNSAYELYVSHHTQNLFGTILYAVSD